MLSEKCCSYSWYIGECGVTIPSNPNVLRERRLLGTERTKLPSLEPGSLTRRGVSLPTLRESAAPSRSGSGVAPLR